MSFCPSCGSSNPDEARFCEKCGATISEAPAPSAAAQDAVRAAEQAKQAISSASQAAGKAVGGFDFKLPVIIAAALVVLLVGYLIFLRPMSASDYENRAEDLVMDLQDAESELQSVVSEIRWSDDSGELDSGDMDDLRETLSESSSAIKKAAKGLRGLRPPSEYKSAHKRLNSWASYMAGDHLDGYAEVIGKQEAGRSYERFSNDLTRFYESTSKESGRAWRDFYRAADDIGIYYEGG